MKQVSLTKAQLRTVNAAIRAVRAARGAVDWALSEDNGDDAFNAAHRARVATLMDECGKIVAGYEDLVVRK